MGQVSMAADLVDYEWVNRVIPKPELSTSSIVGVPIFAPVSGFESISRISRFQWNPVVTLNESGALAAEYRGRLRHSLYQTAVRIAENEEMRRLLKEAQKLLDLSIKSREQHFKTSHESHLALMELQNQRSVVANRLSVLSNRWSVLVFQRELLAPKGATPSSLPVILSLTAPVFSDPDRLIQGNAQLRILNATTNRIRNAFQSGLKMEVAFLIAEINNLASEYAMYSDELQLRRQESVAAALAGMEARRLTLPDVLRQKRLLLRDGLEMARIRCRQHELVADLVYLCGGESYEGLLKSDDE